MDVAKIVDRLAQLHGRVETLKREKAKIRSLRGPESPMRPTPFDGGKRIPTRLESVRDDIGGLDYAAWCIGETLFACGGMELLDQVYSAFEVAHGARASAWLDHRWNGVGSWVS